MSRERDCALLSMELCDSAEDLLRRFQNYNSDSRRDGGRAYKWAARVINSLNEEKQRQLKCFDNLQREINP
jgi:hypothetical protein